jgi:heterodisulfide reductase subunit A-like polyferredoxin
MCILSPKLVECGRHPNVELLTYSQLLGIEGEPGDFKAKVLKRSRFIDPLKCTGCGECAEVCPVAVANEFDQGLGERKAIYRPYAQAFPNVFTIDKQGRSPCVVACPAGVNAQGYIALISQGKFGEALEVVRRTMPFPGTIGRVCNHFCELDCERKTVDEPMSIRSLKRFIADYEMQAGREKATPVARTKEEKVAIVGSGPAGLACAYDLIREGYPVTVFEAMPQTGGLLRYGIPEYRLPNDVLDYEVNYIEELGVEIKPNTPVKDLSQVFDQGYGAIFLGTGAWTSQRMGIPGEETPGVLHALDFLRRVNAGEKVELGNRVAVIGGGNAAIDAARVAWRLGAEDVTLVYRRSRAEMPAQDVEIEEAEKEGIKLHILAAPTRIHANDGKLASMECIKMELGAPDASGRRRPVPVEGSEFNMDVDNVIIAIGQAVDKEAHTAELGFTDWGTLSADQVSLETNIAGVFAGGDAVSGPAGVIEAIAAGKEAAISIDRYLRGLDPKEGRPPTPQRVEHISKEGVEKRQRPAMPLLSVVERRGNFAEVDLGLSEDAVLGESTRCLNCACCCECLQCVATCKAEAVNHALGDELLELEVGSVILAPGYEVFDAKLRGEYGYGRYQNVVTSMEFERILSASGPYQGAVLRPYDKEHPKKVAWIQCVGSRDTSLGNGYCSSVCCMYAIKEAVIAKEHQPDLDLTIFYNDIRAFGKGFDAYYENAKKAGVRFVKSIVSGVKELQQSKDLLLSYADNGEVKEEEFDMVVLSVGLMVPPELRGLAEMLGLKLNHYGFCQTDEFGPTETSRPGILVCGAFQSPKDIPETVMQASSAAAQASAILSTARGTMVKEKEYPPQRDVSGEPPRIGVFICHCGINIGGVVSVPEVVEYAETLPNVVIAEANLYTCSQDTQEHIREKIEELGLNRAVVASCTPRTHEPLFQETLKESGLSPYLFTMANIRDQCSWVHMQEKDAATEKAKDLLRIAVARARIAESLEEMSLPVTPAGLVVGGGVSGMQAALGLAQQGFDVHLVEKEQELGGIARRISSTLEGGDVQAYLNDLIEKVSGDHLIHIYTDSEVIDTSGYVGNFSTQIRTSSGEEVEVKHGASIIAIGGREYQPTEYLYGNDPRVVTLLELEEKIAKKDTKLLSAKNIVITLCVGSREEARNYCSRVCCSQAVKCALRLKELVPEMNVYVLYRDIRTYSLKEDYYRKAREQGVLFIRFEPEDKPRVEGGDTLKVEVTEPSLGEKVLIEADMLALAAATLPPSDNRATSQVFKTSLDENGFFLEAHVKLRPVDFAGEGFFLCGLAHGPKSIEECISQAQAAVSRACTILSKKSMRAGGVVSAVDVSKCVGCGVCEAVCAFGAVNLEYNERLGRNVAVVTQASCKGCGVCASTCRSSAIDLKGFSDSEILEMVDAL